jgi:hypothetical protein
LPTAWFSLILLISPYVIFPQSSCAFGSLAAMAAEGLLNNVGLTWLFTNGAPRLTCLPALQAGDANVLKSPASIAAVGTYLIVVPGSERVLVP